MILVSFQIYPHNGNAQFYCVSGEGTLFKTEGDVPLAVQKQRTVWFNCYNQLIVAPVLPALPHGGGVVLALNRLIFLWKTSCKVSSLALQF